MNYIIFDLEWNQSPGGKSSSEAMMPFEIIQIGAVKLDENMSELGEYGEYSLLYRRGSDDEYRCAW